jgi:hypothetical protein
MPKRDAMVELHWRPAGMHARLRCWNCKHTTEWVLLDLLEPQYQELEKQCVCKRKRKHEADKPQA